MAQRYQFTEIVTAVQWTGEVTAEMAAFLGDQPYVVSQLREHRNVLEILETKATSKAIVEDVFAEQNIGASTSQPLPALVGDWVLKAPDGEIFYTLCAAEFAATYTPAREPIEFSFQIPTKVTAAVDGFVTVTLRPQPHAFATMGEVLPQLIRNCDMATLDSLAKAVSSAQDEARARAAAEGAPPGESSS